MKMEREQPFSSEYDRKSSINETTYTSFLPINQYEVSLKKNTLNASESEAQRRSSIITSSNSTLSIGSSSDQRKAILKWFTSQPSEIHRKTFKPKLSTFLLPKLHVTNFQNLKYDFQLPSQTPKYPYDVSDKEELQQALLGNHWRGISVNIHINTFFILGDILVTLIIFTMSAFQALLLQFTNYETKKLSVRLINYSCLTFLVVRNFIQCIKITTYHRRLVYRLRDIILHRFTQPIFLTDCVIIILLCIQIQLEEEQVVALILYIICYLKVFPLRWHFYILEKIYLDSLKEKLWWNIFKMFVLNIYFAHSFATVLLAFYYLDKVHNWIVYFGYSSRPWYEIYIWALYWSAGIISNSGFGDIYPVSLQQALVVSQLKMLTLSIVVLIDVIRMDAILRLRDSSFRIIGIFRNQANNDRISNDLKQRIQRYLKKAQKDDTNLTYQQRIAFLKSLPTSLQEKYQIQFIQKKLRFLPLFQLLSISTLKKFAVKIYQIHYSPKDIILKSNIRKPDKISILKTGAISFLYKKIFSSLNGRIIHTFRVEEEDSKIKDPFLIDQIFMEKTKILNYDVRVEQISKVLHLNLNDFFDVIRQSQADKEYFFSLYHRHSLFPNQWSNVKCENCLNKFHTLFECPKMHYIPIREVVYFKQTQPGSFRSKNDRNIFYHRRRSKFRQKQRRNQFFMRKYFQRLEQQLGVRRSLSKILSGSIKQSVPELDEMEEKQSNSASFQMIDDSFLPLLAPRSRLSSSASIVKLFLRDSHFFDKEYLYKQNRQLIDSSGKENCFRELKNRLFDLITERLEPEFHGFWEVEIDKMHNFKYYFPKYNPNNLFDCQLTKNKLFE